LAPKRSLIDFVDQACGVARIAGLAKKSSARQGGIFAALPDREPSRFAARTLAQGREITLWHPTAS